MENKGCICLEIIWKIKTFFFCQAEDSHPEQAEHHGDKFISSQSSDGNARRKTNTQEKKCIYEYFYRCNYGHAADSLLKTEDTWLLWTILEFWNLKKNVLKCYWDKQYT